jgi:hypothetical protein
VQYGDSCLGEPSLDGLPGVDLSLSAQRVQFLEKVEQVRFVDRCTEGKALKDDQMRWRGAALEAPCTVPDHGVSPAMMPPSPYSAASSVPSATDSPPEARSQDEHERAVAAFLRENGFVNLTRPRRQRFVGTTHPLHCAASQGLVRMTELLVKAGANPRQKNSWGQTPLDIARRCNRKGSHEGVLEVLQRVTAVAAA